jgi:hypothetical protein
VRETFRLPFAHPCGAAKTFRSPSRIAAYRQHVSPLLRLTSSLTQPSPQEESFNIRLTIENPRDWICRTVIRKTKTGQQLFLLLGQKSPVGFYITANSCVIVA